MLALCARPATPRSPPGARSPCASRRAGLPTQARLEEAEAGLTQSHAQNAELAAQVESLLRQVEDRKSDAEQADHERKEAAARAEISQIQLRR